MEPRELNQATKPEKNSLDSSDREQDVEERILGERAVNVMVGVSAKNIPVLPTVEEETSGIDEKVPTEKAVDNEDPASDKTPAALVVSRLLMINAWRKTRRRNKRLMFSTRRMKIQVSSLRLQVKSLQTLLKGETDRVGRVCNTMCRLKALVDYHSRARKKVLLENKIQMNELKLFEEKVYKLEEKCLNYENTHITILEDFKIMECQLGKEREKIAKLRKEKTSAINKIQTYEDVLVKKSTVITELQKSIDELESLIVNQTVVLSTAEADTERALTALKSLRERYDTTAVQIAATLGESTRLLQRVAELEDAFVAKEAELVTAVSIKDAQIGELTRQLREHNVMPVDQSWSGRAMSLMSSVVRTPLQAIFFVLSPRNNTNTR